MRLRRWTVFQSRFSGFATKKVLHKTENLKLPLGSALCRTVIFYSAQGLFTCIYLCKRSSVEFFAVCGNLLANHRPMLLQQGEVQAGEQADDVIAQLRSGILSHEKAEELWSSWQGW